MFTIVDIQRHLQSDQGGVVRRVNQQLRELGGGSHQSQVLPYLSQQDSPLKPGLLCLLVDSEEEAEAKGLQLPLPKRKRKLKSFSRLRRCMVWGEAQGGRTSPCVFSQKSVS